MTVTEIRNNKLKKKISTIFFTNKQRYGATKIHQVLLKEGISVSLKHVQKLMKQLNLRSIVVKKYRPQRSNKPILSKENLLNQDFSTKTICEKWAADITYIPTRGPERLVGICIDKGYKFPLNQCFKAYLFFIFNSLKCLGIDNKSNLYSPRKVICSQLIGDTCFIYLVTSGSILTR
ncbi:IS3 family transposase [Enterococcus faecalis]|nr:IS3 family transposase [Enterococcus faecalis]EHB4976927.1 IS3 family transposase [Enterococcus faecalis]